jgi:elongation factor P
MTTSSHLSPGLTIMVGNTLYRVESAVKVTMAKGKGAPFIKTQLRDLTTNKVTEKSFKLNQSIKEVQLNGRALEFLYLEGKDYLFLDVGTLEKVLIPTQVVGDNSEYLKEGVQIIASFYGDSVFTVELPQFLELMTAEVGEKQDNNGNKQAILETGAKVKVPSFIQAGDIIKVDTRNHEYIQRV